MPPRDNEWDCYIYVHMMRRVGADPDSSTGIHIRLCSDPELFTIDRRAQKYFFLLLELKNGFIFTPVYQPDCSSVATEFNLIKKTLFVPRGQSVEVTSPGAFSAK